MTPHPDRLAPTLAARELLPPAAFVGPFAPPGTGSADARVDLKLLAARTFRALHARGTDAAFARLQGLWGPDLWAGTVQDGVARGFASALEDALSLCAPEPPAPVPEPAPAHEVTVVRGRELARRKDLLVASAGPRVRWSRKSGIHYVDRERGVNVEHAVLFEDRADLGTLDGFVPDDAQPARLFSPQFLAPELWEQGPGRDLLVLAGVLGPRARGFPCRLAIEGRKSESVLRLTVTIENRFPDHRLRIRFPGLADPALVDGDASLPVTAVTHGRGTFLACTLVRACGRLDVGGATVPVPSAQCLGEIVHGFVLG